MIMLIFKITPSASQWLHTNLFTLFFANEERVFAEHDVCCTLQLVTAIGRYVELHNVVDHQSVLSDLVTITERDLDRTARETAGIRTYT